MNNLGEYAKCIWFTGLSGAGKSTLAEALKLKLDELNIPSVLIDGDIVRKGINNKLGFSNADRKENIRRVAELVKIINNSGVYVICAFISPGTDQRQMAKNIIGENNYFEVFVDTPLEVCIKRDIKGLYRKAMQGEIKNFTGISAPYEKPVSPDLKLDSSKLKVIECIEKIIELLGINKKV